MPAPCQAACDEAQHLLRVPLVLPVPEVGHPLPGVSGTVSADRTYQAGSQVLRRLRVDVGGGAGVTPRVQVAVDIERAEPAKVTRASTRPRATGRGGGGGPRRAGQQGNGSQQNPPSRVLTAPCVGLGSPPGGLNPVFVHSFRNLLTSSIGGRGADSPAPGTEATGDAQAYEQPGGGCVGGSR